MPRQIEDNESPFQRAIAEGLVNSSGNSTAVKKRGPKRGEDWAPVFLAALQCGATVRRAARQAGVDGTMPFKRRAKDKEFARSWNESADIGTRLLEQEAQRRAYHGVIKPVFQKGVKVGQVNEYSDTLMIFLLKARRPEKYRDSPAVVNNNVNQVSVGEVFDDISRDTDLILGRGSEVAGDLQADRAAEPVGKTQADFTQTTPEADRVPAQV